MQDSRVAVVTGGGAGIGRAITETLLDTGLSVLILDVNGSATKAAMTDLQQRKYPGAVEMFEGSVTSSADLRSAFDHAERTLGPVDVLVNNAGFANMALIVDLTEEEWNAVLGVLATGTFLGTRELARRTIARGGTASIVNISSLNYTAATDGLAHYCAGKAAVSMFTQVAASELGRHGIRVNAVAPGLIRTELTERHQMTTGLSGERFLERTPLGRIGEPADIAKVVAFLVSDASGWITGETISVDGGTHIKGLHSYWDTLQAQLAEAGT
jgi:glucose 1-dehydrogenase